MFFIIETNSNVTSMSVYFIKWIYSSSDLHEKQRKLVKFKSEKKVNDYLTSYATLPIFTDIFWFKCKVTDYNGISKISMFKTLILTVTANKKKIGWSTLCNIIK